MEQVKSFNVYVKNGKGFAVVETKDGRAISINLGLIDYAMKHVRYCDKKEASTNAKEN